MEYLLLPHYRGNPPTQVPKVPYISAERYDGSPFISYPAKVGRPNAGLAWFDQSQWYLELQFNPVPIRELEAFVQTWLFFGLIAEVLGATEGDGIETSMELELSSRNRFAVLTPREVRDLIYDTVCVQREDNSIDVVLDTAGLDLFLDVARARWPSVKENREKRYGNITKCMICTSNAMKSVPKEFDRTIRHSIAAISEIFSVALKRFADEQGIGYDLIHDNATEYFDRHVREDMMRHGWCPDDISRVAHHTALSPQLAFMASMMDKTLQQRDHSNCEENFCRYSQIDMSRYQLQHQDQGCKCSKALVDSDELTRILEDGDKIVLLRLVGEGDDLKVELVESNNDTPYIAISHVWADGLGNPFENSLHRCKLIHLRNLVSQVKTSSREGAEPLIWLDTLCCPAQDGTGKRLAIEKIRLVYQNAELVLVLDAGLLPYEARIQDIPEKLLRIFTSGWMRRLWTLQEGALPKSLYFQFADEAVSLFGLRIVFLQLANTSIRHRNVLVHIWRQFLAFEAFFPGGDKLPNTISKLILLDEVLLHRSVTVSTDEPLCIGTLLKLDLGKIIAVEPKEDRMQKVWELIGESEEGIPANMIFLEETKIDAPGWRWALKSFLRPQKVLHQQVSRFLQTPELGRGKIDPRGLRVQYPGYRIRVRNYSDGKPRNPWPGMTRVAESTIMFRDRETGKLYLVADKVHALRVKNFENDEERKQFNSLKRFPLHDLADGDEAGVVMDVGHTQGPTGPAVFGVLVDDRGIEGDNEKGMKLESRFRVIVSPCSDDLGYLHDTVERLALEAKANEVTDKYLATYARLQARSSESDEVLEEKMKKDQEFKASKEALCQYFKDIMGKVILEDERFVAAVKTNMGGDMVENVWGLVREWYRDDYIGERLGNETVWFVD